MTVRLAYGYQHWTTAVHLQHALARVGDVVAVGPGHDTTDPGAGPLLWVESGISWVPTPAALAAGPSGGYLIDTHRGYGWRARLARAFDVAFTAQRPAADRLLASGVNALWLPLAAPKELCGPGSAFADRPYDVAFVGQAPAGSFRAALLDAARARFSVAPVEGRLEPAQMMDVYRSARVILNDPIAGDLNMRAFEAPGARALQVTVDVPGLTDLLPASACTLVGARDVDVWLRAIDETLRDPSAQARADDAHQHVVNGHTYDDRVATVLDRLAATPRRTFARHERERALAAAWARWGDAGAIGTLGLPLAAQSASVLGSFGWRAASAAARVQRRLRANSR